MPLGPLMKLTQLGIVSRDAPLDRQARCRSCRSARSARHTSRARQRFKQRTIFISLGSSRMRRWPWPETAHVDYGGATFRSTTTRSSNRDHPHGSGYTQSFHGRLARARTARVSQGGRRGQGGLLARPTCRGEQATPELHHQRRGRSPRWFGRGSSWSDHDNAVRIDGGRPSSARRRPERQSSVMTLRTAPSRPPRTFTARSRCRSLPDRQDCRHPPTTRDATRRHPTTRGQHVCRPRPLR